jgi:hypothetical protein
MSKELRIKEQSCQFRSLTELTWTKNTIYPRDKVNFRTFEPRGQCGITNFGFGVWLVWRGLASPDRLFYAEGKVHDAEGELIDDRHAWLLRSRAFSKLLRHVDLTLDQYPDIDQPVVAGVVKRSEAEADFASYRLPLVNNEQPRHTTNAVYSPDTVTPLADYDTVNFRGRLDTFLGSCYNSTSFMGQQAIRGAVSDLWLPHDSAQIKEDRLETLTAKPCDAQLFSSI